MPIEFRPSIGTVRESLVTSHRSEGTLLLDQNRPDLRVSFGQRAVNGPRKDLVTLNNFELIARS